MKACFTVCCLDVIRYLGNRCEMSPEISVEWQVSTFVCEWGTGDLSKV